MANIENRITADITFEQSWAHQICPDPRLTVDEMREQDFAFRAFKNKMAGELKSNGSDEIYRTIGELSSRFGRARSTWSENASENKPKSVGRNSARPWKWYDARYMIATALGAPKPVWDGTTYSWWMDREQGNPLNAGMSPAEVSAIPIPDWKNLPQVHEMFQSRERWVKAFPDDIPPFSNVSQLDVHAGEKKWFLGFPSFVDLGIFLLGTSDFLAELGMESELAEALLDKSFELSTSYLEFMHSVYPIQMELLLGFAGDTACLLSPSLYKKYSVRWDAMLFEYVQNRYGCAENFPCNLHSCGPSVHLYDAWGEHPHNDNIVVLQTRLVPGTVGSLRKTMKKSVLQLTFHPQHYDVVNAASDDFKHVLINSADSAERRDVHFSVIAVANRPEEVPMLQTNINVMLLALEELNASL
ncbi:MAG: hypothetical protein HN368_06340 [Spirochaetales bacterium]|jgi:hypothetical protein|nr:hypothetical protein [Spirochaetales bacterium]